jgi:hypothetical protein
MEGQYTDHLQHEYASWAFLHIGYAVFGTPIGEWHVHAANAHPLWHQLPSVYPPGLILFFMPFGVASNTGAIPDERVHMLMVMLLSVAAVLATVQLWRTLSLTYDVALAVVLTVLGAVVFVTWGLDGFIDPLTAGVALLGLWWQFRGRPGPALVAVTAALSLHFRIWYLWPIAIAIAWRARREIRAWQFAVSGVLALASLVAFAYSAPSLARLDPEKIPDIRPNYLVLTHGLSVEASVAFIAALVVAGLVMRYEPIEVAAAFVLALVLVFFVDQWQAWYPVLFLPIVATMRARVSQIAVTLVYIEAVYYLGGFPDVVRLVHLFSDAVS